MVTILGFEVALPEFLLFLHEPVPAFVLNLLAWIFIALVLNFIVMRFLLLITKQLPGDLEDIILGIIRTPIFLLVILFGVNKSLQLLPLINDATVWIHRISLSILVFILAHVVGHLIKDVLVYYGAKWAARTESQVDDVLVPVFSLFGPILVTIVAALLILPLWGVNVSSVLVGAGVLGLVLGLALQETLGNIFSGLSLIMEAPFKKGDLILLPNGKISEVLKLGLRSTTLFSLDEQATVFKPNKSLASESIVNLTKPTAEQRYTLEFEVAMKNDMVKVKELLLSITNGHPAILSSRIPAKIEHVKKQVIFLRKQSEDQMRSPIENESLATEANANEKSIGRLELEGKLNEQLNTTKESLRNLIRAIKEREIRGLNEMERQELVCNFLSPCDKNIHEVVDLVNQWSHTEDGWLNSTDYWNLVKIWEARKEILEIHWQGFKKAMQDPNDRLDTRLDDMAAKFIDWIDNDFKIVPGYWKDPAVEIKSVNAQSALVLLHYYVDNIRLEKDGRPRRVRTELNRIIRDQFLQEGIWS